MLVMLVEGSTRYTGIARNLLNARGIVWLGGLSYSLYLWQQPFLNRTGSSGLNVFPLNLAVAMGFACVSLYLVEQPFLRFGRRFRRHGAAMAQSRGAELPD